MAVDYNLGNLVVDTQVKNAEQSIQALTGIRKSLNSLKNSMKHFTDTNTNLDNISTNFKKIASAIKPLTNELKAAKSACDSFNTTLKAIGYNQKTKTSIKQSIFGKTATEKIFNIGKLYAGFNYVKKYAVQIAKSIQYAVDFEETLNKYQVSMGEQYQQSLKFVDNLTRAFNLSTESIMNYQSTFKNMLDSLGGLSTSTTYKLSETITRMAIDYGSLFNVPIERAMEQFQQVLSGQIRTIRTVAGFDVSETTLFQFYKELGGTKTMRQLDQNEKRLLRIIALQKQMARTGATGDFEKTLSNTANVLKQIQETTKEVLTLFGRLFLGIIGKGAENLLGATIALRDFLNYLNKIRGYEYADYTKGGLFGNLEESATKAEEAVNSLKTTLLGFDKLNILSGGNTTTATSGDSDYNFLASQISNYKELTTNLEIGSQKVANSILEWFGYTRNVNGEIEKAENGMTRLQKIISLIKTTLVGLLSVNFAKKGFAILKGFASFKGKISKLEKLGSSVLTAKEIATSTSLIKPFKSTTTIIGALEKSKVFSFLTKPGKLIGNLLTALPKSLVAIGTIATIFATLLLNSEEFRNSIMNLIKSIVSLAASISSILTPVLKPIITFIGEGLALVINIIAKVIDFISKSKALTAVLGTLLAAIIAINIASSISPLTWIILGITTVIALIAKLIEWIAKLFREGKVQSFFKNLFGSRNNSSGRGNSNTALQAAQSSYTPLASGGVITRPTPALIGEYSGARSNPEIVSPESKMREVFAQSTLPLAQAIIASNQRVIEAIDDLSDRPINLNGRKVSESIFKDLQNEATRRGKSFA